MQRKKERKVKAYNNMIVNFMSRKKKKRRYHDHKIYPDIRPTYAANSLLERFTKWHQDN